MNPQSHEVHIQHTFDAFCKKVLKNEALDYYDEITRKSKKEIHFSELPVETMEQLSSDDRYFKENKTFGVLGHIVYIDNEDLAAAIAALSDNKRAIILLSYFLDMSDREIAEALKMVRRTVTYRRTSTLKLLCKLADWKLPNKLTVKKSVGLFSDIFSALMTSEIKFFSPPLTFEKCVL